MAQIRVSVIVPCHNGGRYLAEALASVLSQERVPDEIVVIDDGSTDESATIARKFSPRIRCIEQEQRGISGARNRGIEETAGKVIAFLDADDVWTRGSLGSRLSVLDDHPELECVSGMVEQFISPELPDDIRRGMACPKDHSSARVAGAMLLRRTAFDRVGDFDRAFEVGETVDWIARADAAGLTTQTISRVVLRRRIHMTNTTLRKKNSQSDYLRALKASLDRRRAAADAWKRP